MNKIKSILKFLDENLIFFLGIFLLVFIPLYPKIPLADLIPGYIVRLRLEDIFIAIAVFIWGIWLIRGKVKLDFPLLKIIIAYLIIGTLSILTNIFITGWIPAEFLHISKSVLHLARYTEYFFVGIIIYSGCTKKWHFQALIGSLFFTLFSVSLYGWGQKYLYWPVFSTMNREFSKGMVLYLTEHARVQSTFAGHYDYAAWLTMILPITFIISLKQKNLALKITGLAIHFFGFWGMTVAAARTSFAAYPVALLVILIIYASWEKTSIWKRLGRFFGWGIFYVIAIAPIMMFFGDSIIERLEQPFNHIKVVRENYEAFKQWKLNGAKLTDIIKIEKPENGVAISLADQELAPITPIVIPSDTNPTTTKPIDVYTDVPDQVVVATETAEGTVYTIEERDRTYSPNAQKYGLSLGIRLDALWPMAIAGFMRNPLFGSGYGTLNKEGAYHFTEADSTDNNYLRTLGETGLLGFITFYGLIFITFDATCKALSSKSRLYAFYSLGLLGSLIAILINATYIDVFASSKVAFTLWGLIGLFYAMRKYYLDQDQRTIRLADQDTSEEKIQQPKTTATAPVAKTKAKTKKSKKNRHQGKKAKTNN